MGSLTRSFSTSSSDINRAWRNKVYDGKVEAGSPDLRKDVKTARFGESKHGRFRKIKKFFNFKSSKTSSGSTDHDFESRLMLEIYKNMSASHELSSMYN
ncbi:hypothetical protein QVD17_04897 [Tagetes erecta]|uniref:Uncharacterized protein n=1 Tax=Tagetes erecta TaxID=13708 RepID=A0AAD8PB36_TARER|nr:hypothetical protein QVD17_04897 [Tagetes erecta]